MGICSPAWCMLLPHGYEGQGPEHSSGRIERYLQLAAKDNIQVCQPSTAGQYFHLLRRQALRNWRKPLIVFTPKGMLRHPDAASPLSEFSDGKFQTVIQEPEIANGERIIVCTGKVGHELRRERKRRNDTKTAIIFLEQLFPLPEAELEAAFAQHTNAREFLWVQEEPANMGALNFLAPQLERLARSVPFRSVKRSRHRVHPRGRTQRMRWSRRHCWNWHSRRFNAAIMQHRSQARVIQDYGSGTNK